MKLLVTGGAGFIGSALVRAAIAAGHTVVNVDALTYAACPESLGAVEQVPGYSFERADVRDEEALSDILRRESPDLVFHLAAESHVDRSIDGPEAFIQTNVLGTSRLLEMVRLHWNEVGRRRDFRFVHVSTDEVFGSVEEGARSDEEAPIAPNSPYAASKAASEHLVRAWNRTFGVPTVITRGVNSYGPWQFPEKLVPVVIGHAIAGRPIPIYGDGVQIREWLYVDDHADALLRVGLQAATGSTYNIGSGETLRNLDLARRICALLDRLRPESAPHGDLIRFVRDRPGHDRRYALDADRITRDLGWTPRHSLADGLDRTVRWYLTNEPLWRPRLRSAEAADSARIQP